MFWRWCHRQFHFRDNECCRRKPTATNRAYTSGVTRNAGLGKGASSLKKQGFFLSSIGEMFQSLIKSSSAATRGVAFSIHAVSLR